MTATGALLTKSLWTGSVVVLLVKESTSSAEGVDMRGRCLTSTEVPRKTAIMWMALIKIDAAVS